MVTEEAERHRGGCTSDEQWRGPCLRAVFRFCAPTRSPHPPSSHPHVLIARVAFSLLCTRKPQGKRTNSPRGGGSGQRVGGIFSATHRTVKTFPTQGLLSPWTPGHRTRFWSCTAPGVGHLIKRGASLAQCGLSSFSCPWSPHKGLAWYLSLCLGNWVTRI